MVGLCYEDGWFGSANCSGKQMLVMAWPATIHNCSLVKLSRQFISLYKNCATRFESGKQNLYYIVPNLSCDVSVFAQQLRVVPQPAGSHGSGLYDTQPTVKRISRVVFP